MFKLPFGTKYMYVFTFILSFSNILINNHQLLTTNYILHSFYKTIPTIKCKTSWQMRSYYFFYFFFCIPNGIGHFDTQINSYTSIVLLKLSSKYEFLDVKFASTLSVKAFRIDAQALTSQ